MERTQFEAVMLLRGRGGRRKVVWDGIPRVSARWWGWPALTWRRWASSDRTGPHALLVLEMRAPSGEASHVMRIVPVLVFLGVVGVVEGALRLGSSSSNVHATSSRFVKARRVSLVCITLSPVLYNQSMLPIEILFKFEARKECVFLTWWQHNDSSRSSTSGCVVAVVVVVTSMLLLVVEVVARSVSRVNCEEHDIQSCNAQF